MEVVDHILVVGVGGTGKSYAVAWMRSESIAAFDGDTVPNLARFVTLLSFQWTHRKRQLNQPI